jgi:hypothetical protein
MCRRVLSAWLIILALLVGSSAPVRARSVNAQADEEKITPEEEREAKQIAGRFIKSFEEKNNLPALMDELYVKDFEARLRAHSDGLFYLVKVEPDVMAKADASDLKRLYVASLDLIYTAGFFHCLNLYNRKLAGEEEEDDLGLEKILPPEALEVMKSDPLMAEMLAEDGEKEREKNSGQASEPEQGINQDKTAEAGTEEVEIRSLERLRRFASTLEKVSLLIRARIKTVPGPRNWTELESAFERLKAVDDKPDECQGTCPRVYILRDEFFGEPEGTRLICVNVLPFHMDLVRVDGRLRILNVYLADD